VGGIEYENFNAATVTLTFTGKSIHPGSAKNKLVNALHLAMEFHQLLPTFLNPAFTEKYEGFNHIMDMKGQVEEAVTKYIVRNHDKTLFKQQKDEFMRIAKFMNETYGYDAVNVRIVDSYYNMYDIIKDHMEVIDLAVEATKSCGIEPSIEPIRGGTDGARLTYDGLICPNIGTGGYQFHGRYEFASINQMHQAVEILKQIIILNAK